MKIALIDHNDSFTFNIVEVLKQLNYDITVINYDTIYIDNIEDFDKIILSPGPCLPENYPKTIALIDRFYKTKPILGVCLGHQAICTYFGAELYTTPNVIHGNDEIIDITNPSKLFKDIPTETTVGLYHSWAVKKEGLSNTLKITAVTKNDMIMAVEHTNYPIYGIQFHPESFLTIDGKQLLKNFIEL